MQEHKKTLLEHLIANLKGRHWEGKDALLECLGEVVTATKEFWEYPHFFDILSAFASLIESNRDNAEVRTVVDLLLAESKKKNRVYRRQALNTLSSALGVFQDVPSFRILVAYAPCPLQMPPHFFDRNSHCHAVKWPGILSLLISGIDR